MSRPGADTRTQVCVLCRRAGGSLESEMIPAPRVVPKRKRGFVCVSCATARSRLPGYSGKWKPPTETDKQCTMF